MSNKSLTVRVPGKLMIAGEFAVLEPYHKLIAMAVDRFVYASLSPSDHSTVSLHNLELINTPWQYSEGQVTIQTEDTRVCFVEFAMEVTLNYLKEQGYIIKPFHLSVNSELDDESGIKYGLGSSAAVVTATVSAILSSFLPTRPEKALIFKLSSLAHVVIQGNGSGADIAASTYGGVIKYTSFQAEWLLKAYEASENLTALIEKDWTYLSIESLTLPQSLRAVIGWTGSPASTAQLVQQIALLKTEAYEKYDAFLKASEESVHEFLRGVTLNDPNLILEGIEKNRQALAQLGKDADVDIETPLLNQLSVLAKKYHGAGKQSGAGGGDCGIAYLPGTEHVEALQSDWEAAGIKVLTLKPYSHGVEKI